MAILKAIHSVLTVGIGFVKIYRYETNGILKRSRICFKIKCKFLYQPSIFVGIPQIETCKHLSKKENCDSYTILKQKSTNIYLSKDLIL